MIVTSPQPSAAERLALEAMCEIAERDRMDCALTEAPRAILSHEEWLGVRDLAVVAHEVRGETWLFFAPLAFGWHYGRGLMADRAMEDSLRQRDLFMIGADDLEGINTVLDAWRRMVRQWSDEAREGIDDG